MLAAGAAEAVERVLGDVETALDRDLLDRVRHVLDRDLEEAVGDLLGRAGLAGGALHLAGECRKFVAHHRGVERPIARGPKHLGEVIRMNLAHHHVGVGDAKRTVAAIARRARVGARTFRPDAEARAVEEQNRAAARRHGVDLHHRRAHAHAGDQRLEGAFVFAVV